MLLVLLAISSIHNIDHQKSSMDLNIKADLEELRETFNSGKTKDASWRRSQLKGLLSLLKEREDDIFKGLRQDLGKHHCEAYRDEVKLPIVAFPSTAELVPEPLGLVLIISSWNFPFGLSFEPLIGAIAAGNVVVLKPSELAPSCSSVLANSISTYLDKKAIKVIQGGVSVGQQLLQHKRDKIFFTGSAQVGRIVLTAAAKHLTPVTLELGGKCPAVVDSLSSSWDREYAADTIPFGGVGESGFGRYHGKFSFDTFTHEKAVLRRSFLTDFWFRYPPWNDHKLQLFKNVYRYDYLGVALTTLGLKKS